MKQGFTWENLGLGERVTTVASSACQPCAWEPAEPEELEQWEGKTPPDGGASKIPKSSCPMTPCSQGLYPVVSIHTETRELRTQRVSETESQKKAAPGIGTTESHLHSKLSKRQALTKSPFSARRPDGYEELRAQGQAAPLGL